MDRASGSCEIITKDPTFMSSVLEVEEKKGRAEKILEKIWLEKVSQIWQKT